MNSTIVSDSIKAIEKISQLSDLISTSDIVSVENNIISYFVSKVRKEDNSEQPIAYNFLKQIDKVVNEKIISESLSNDGSYECTLFSNFKLKGAILSTGDTEVLYNGGPSATIEGKMSSVMLLIKEIKNPFYENFTQYGNEKVSSDIVSIDIYDENGYPLK